MDSYKIERVDLKTLCERGVLNYIGSMDLSVSSKMPREEELAKILGVSRITLREALNTLENRGIIFRRHGKGTFVNTHSFGIKVPLNPGLNFFAMIRERNYTPHAEHIFFGKVAAPKEVARAFGILEGADVYLCKKLFWADKIPCAFIEDYLDISLFGEEFGEGIEESSENIFQYIFENSKIKIEGDRIEIDTILSNSFVDLDVFSKNGNPTPMLLLRGVNYDESGEVVMFTNEYINTEIIKYSQTRKREIDY